MNVLSFTIIFYLTYFVGILASMSYDGVFFNLLLVSIGDNCTRTVNGNVTMQ